MKHEREIIQLPVNAPQCLPILSIVDQPYSVQPPVAVLVIYTPAEFGRSHHIKVSTTWRLPLRDHETSQYKITSFTPAIYDLTTISDLALLVYQTQTRLTPLCPLLPSCATLLLIYRAAHFSLRTFKTSDRNEMSHLLQIWHTEVREV